MAKKKKKKINKFKLKAKIRAIAAKKHKAMDEQMKKAMALDD